MNSDSRSKVQAQHLKRNAYVYIRQSSPRQVLENVESTKRQYDLRQRAVALGWSIDQVIIIDKDQGQSGKSSTDREGFQHLVAEVSLERAGIVMGLEVSRLARNSSDWHRLLEICALTNTLVLDDDGLYDPTDFNDRLLLGLKGTMSEAELHVLRARLRGGIVNKARRGELEIRLPVGFVYDPQGRVRLDPDKSVQDSIRQLFRIFQRTGSASATVKAFRDEGLKFPHRVYREPNKGGITWSDLDHSRTRWVLHHPRYAGAFCFGRRRTRKFPGGRTTHEKLPPDQWTALIRDAHDSYITWEQFDENVKRLRDNSLAYGAERKKGPAREGPALLQGLAICAVCGARMSIHYHQRRGRLVPDYMCQSDRVKHAQPVCQRIPGGTIDEAVGKLLVETMTPLTLEVALAVQKELESRCEETERLRLQEVERARYLAELARRRFMNVDPDNRLVADSLEAEWNQALRALAAAKDHYEKQRETDRSGLTDAQRATITALAQDFPRLWNDPHTPPRERKRMARLLIADVTLFKDKELRVQVRFNGGTTHTLTLHLPKSAWMLRQTSDAVVREIDRLLDGHTDAEIAEILNNHGMTSGEGKPFGRLIVRRIRIDYELESRYSRLRARGLLNVEEIAAALGVCRATIQRWCRAGLLRAHRCDDSGQYLFERPGTDAPVKYQHQEGKTTVRSAS
jgi:DNA invertase Pin-like site-specific DNA recombinase